MTDDVTGPMPGAGGVSPKGQTGLLAAPRDRFRYVLLLRFILINFVAAAMVVAAAIQGWVGLVFGNDPTRLTLVICAVFVFGFMLCGWKILQVSQGLNIARAFDPASPDTSFVGRYITDMRDRTANSRAISADAMRQRFGARIAVVRHVANSLVFLGLIGTVIGFIIALSGVHPEAVTELDNVAPMVSTLIRGMSVALYTTLIGAVFSIWLMVNYRLLATGTVMLVNAVIELGEAHARS